MGRSTPTTAFDGTIWYFANTMKTHWTYAWRSLVQKKYFLTKWKQWELRQLFPYMAFVYALIVPLLGQLFPYMAFVYALIVPLLGDQLLPQLLMKQFDTLSIQCRHIEHMHEGVYNFCLHRFYWNLLFKTKVCWFELWTRTCQVFSWLLLCVCVGGGWGI